MTPEMQQLYASLVDVQPVYNLVTSGVCRDDEKAVADFARWKLERAEKAMRTAANYVKSYLASLEPSIPEEKGNGE